jgi:hypothetical protein
MSFSRTYNAISQMIPHIALKTETARAIVRKAGFRPGGEGGGEGIAVLTCSVSDGERTLAEQQGMENLPPGYTWDDQIVGAQTWFNYPLPLEKTWWPDADEFGLFTTATDLSSCSQIKNGWVIAPGGANPNVNIRIMASLDGITWAYPTPGDDWHFAGANVNCGQWLTYTTLGAPYQNYPPRYEAHEGQPDALPGGWKTSLPTTQVIPSMRRLITCRWATAR